MSISWHPSLLLYSLHCATFQEQREGVPIPSVSHPTSSYIACPLQLEASVVKWQLLDQTVQIFTIRLNFSDLIYIPFNNHKIFGLFARSNFCNYVEHFVCNYQSLNLKLTMSKASFLYFFSISQCERLLCTLFAFNTSVSWNRAWFFFWISLSACSILAFNFGSSYNLNLTK